MLHSVDYHGRVVRGIVRCAQPPILSTLPFLYIRKFCTFETLLMILLHISETTSGKIQVSAVIPMSLNEVKTQKHQML